MAEAEAVVEVEVEAAAVAAAEGVAAEQGPEDGIPSQPQYLPPNRKCKTLLH